MNTQKYTKKPVDLKWVLVPGRTYSIKDQLKELGCRFGERTLPDGTNQRGWFHDPISQNTSEIHVLAESLPPEPDRSDWVAISGKTFELKEVLKGRFNARWDSENKAWIVAPEFAKDAQSIVDCAGFTVVDNTGNPQGEGDRETETRIQALEDEGLTRSDAQGVVLAEDTKERAAQ